jgi:radical SAM-linked protein
LDLIRELPRAIRRAGVRTAYTRGFHPKPDMTFGPALSLGVASLDEYLDVSLVEAPEPEELVRRLQETSSSGLRFVAAVRLEAGDPAVSAVVNAARYVIAFADSALRPLGGRAALAQKVEAFLAKSEHVVRRNVEGVGKLVDVRRFTLDARLGDSDAEQTLRDAGLVGALVPLEVTLSITQNGSTKITELVESVLGEPGFPHHAVRVRLLAGATTPLDVLAFRRTAAPREPDPTVISA